MNYPVRPFRVMFCLSLAVLLPAALRAAETPVEAKAEPAPANAVENSVVKIFATMRYPDPLKPWTKQAPHDITGTGVVIEGKRILTNAHVALYASQVQVQANQSGDKLAATVEFVAPGIDLAVLKLEDETFFASHPALARAPKLPQVKDSVMVYGFPTGGTSLSITKGIVSRIEFTGYGFPVSGLRVQIDAAINPGNSGGPALAGDQMIGIAFSRLNNADNIGYIIPCEEIDLFLKDIADGHYDGKPAMHDRLQSFENPALRTWLKLPKATEGIIVDHPDDPDPNYPLKKWDVITRIGDVPVDNEGMIKVSENLRVRFLYEIQKIAAKGKVPLTVVRAGKELSLEVPVPTDRPMLIPDMEGDYPPYFIYGPLVFSIATTQLTGPLIANTKVVTAFISMGSPLVTRRSDRPAFPGEELVIVSSPFFPHKLAKGYDNPLSRTVSKVNGVPIKNLNHLVGLLRDTTDEFVVIEFAGRAGESLVFPHKEMIAATEDILTDNGIRSQGSSETMEIWKAKAAKSGK